MAEVSLARWQPHLEAAEQAGLSIAEYARQHGLSRHTLYVARQTLRQRSEAVVAPTTQPAGRDRFVGVHVSAASVPSVVQAVEIRVSERVLLCCPHWPDPLWLAALVRAVEPRP